ncbi:type I restriction enzyme R subunit [Wenyingzhuangia heitensis]|uniref:Type I restriction enzyme endonuclease subunit n=1 Tax=Wenyingzhuangia heitensis TaxID=1487859 RepID=A0ABX0U6S3_9FLAO|nr:HsdR family type I site-specific deoxyribonuclease [Wenyingzhuangia heitensis]NIJ44453.1 type I restriction enzyme R subunit [Wenyingzhuangia heitensis]
MKFTEAQLEQAFVQLLQEKEYPHVLGTSLLREEHEVLIKEDLKQFLAEQYKKEGITASEIESIVRMLTAFSALDLYDSNKAIMKLVSDGFAFKREDASKKDVWIYLIDYSEANKNQYKFVNQLEIVGSEKRIPDGIIYINGLPLVVFEFKSAIREEVQLKEAYDQLTIRYRRDIPQLFKYNALCVVSDGVNNKVGSFFSKYGFFYAWRSESDRQFFSSQKGAEGFNSMHSMIHGFFNQKDLRNVIKNFVYLPDTNKQEQKIVCRYPQYYAANKLYQNIIKEQKPLGSGKGGTYFGATGCGKSFTMLFLARLLMKSTHFASPTIIVITDRTDLDTQLSEQFQNAKGYIGDQHIISVESRTELRERLQGLKSGGVFLTTIHKFTEDTELLTGRTNVICISDEAHRSQTNLNQKVSITEKGVKKTYGFAKYLHDSLPNATYVGFTGTPVDATLDVFGDVVDAYTMTESVKDEITVRIVYEGRAAKIALSSGKLKEIEDYYKVCEEEGANEYQVEESKKASANMNAILGDPDRIKALAEDFIKHYETRVHEGSSVRGKAMFVCSSRQIAYAFYQELIQLRPEWKEVKQAPEGVVLTANEKEKIKSMERVKMVMTRGKDDVKELWDLLGTKEHRKELDRQFKNEKSNFKIAIVVDMWLTGFDVPFLDTIYIDKPIQQHNLIQTISRVNRTFQGKGKGLVVDYIGIKKQMNLALAQYNKADSQNFEDIEASVIVVKDHLDLLGKLFHKFDATKYYTGIPLEQLDTLNKAAEYAQVTQEVEKRFMYLVKRLKAAYDICGAGEMISEEEKETIHFYLAVRSIVFKLTKGEAPDISQMNEKVREMIKDAIASEGVEEIFKMGEDNNAEYDIFEDDYLAKIEKIKLPNTKIKLLQQLLNKAISDFKKVNKSKGVDFSKKMKILVDQYNERKDNDVLRSEVLEDFTDEIMKLFEALKKEKESFKDLDIDIEEKAFYDILEQLAIKYDFTYPNDKLLHLAKLVKNVVDDKTKYTDWSKRDDIKSELKVDLIILLAENDYPPVDRDEIYKEIFEQAENFKKYR